jgi:trehalose/maltose transport system substrate-binding protein
MFTRAIKSVNAVAMKKFFVKFVIFSLLLSALFDAKCITLRITCRSKGREIELCKKAVKEWAKKYGGEHTVEIVTLPHASNECFALYQQWLSAETFDVDIMQMDVAWVGVFSDHLLDLGKICVIDQSDLGDYFDAIKSSMYSSGGSLIALPWYTDCGVMYYRKDLLKKYGKRVPTTWEELYETALYIQTQERKNQDKKNKFYGFVFQAKAFEILTCNFVEFEDSFGGSIMTNNRLSIDSQKCINSVLFMIKCIKNISSRSSLNYSEEDARGMFQSGNAVFMRNWPYAWSLMNEEATLVSGKIGIMPIPPSRNGGKSSGVLGGWFLGVSKYSKHAELAADLAKFLTSRSQAKFRAKYSYLPPFKSLYNDRDVLRVNPFFSSLCKPLENAAVRPSILFGKYYSRASSEIFNSINTVLTDAVENDKITDNDVRRSLIKLRKKLDRILKKKKRNEINSRGAMKKSNADGLLHRVKEFLGFGDGVT